MDQWTSAYGDAPIDKLQLTPGHFGLIGGAVSHVGPLVCMSLRSDVLNLRPRATAASPPGPEHAKTLFYHLSEPIPLGVNPSFLQTSVWDRGRGDRRQQTAGTPTSDVTVSSEETSERSRSAGSHVSTRQSGKLTYLRG